MRVISVVNQKGGCGKTTTAINIAAALALLGRRVLLVDLDPQAHATIGLGYDSDTQARTVYDVFAAPGICVSQVAVGTNVPLLELAPCNVLLAGVELELAGVQGKELMLARSLQAVRDKYDIVVIDCPPSLGVLTLNALVTSTQVLVPVQVHSYALEGPKRLMETIRIIRERFHPFSVEKVGLLLTFVEERTTLSKHIEQQMREVFGDLVFRTVIHKNAKVAEAPGCGESVLTYAPNSRGCADYKALAAEILNIAGRDGSLPPAGKSEAFKRKSPTFSQVHRPHTKRVNARPVSRKPPQSKSPHRSGTQESA